jgi:hypothetical protein
MTKPEPTLEAGKPGTTAWTCSARAGLQGPGDLQSPRGSAYPDLG